MMHGELVWPPETAADLLNLWEQREQRYVLRKHTKTEAEKAMIVVARRQDVAYLSDNERERLARLTTRPNEEVGA